jgi:hypothetical protein
MVAVLGAGGTRMICPSCKENRAHRSHRRNFKDRIVALISMKPYRCHTCNHRFYAYRDGETSPRLRTAEEIRIMRLRRKMRWKKSRVELAAYGICSIIVAAVIYYLIQQRVTGG